MFFNSSTCVFFRGSLKLEILKRMSTGFMYLINYAASISCSSYYFFTYQIFKYFDSTVLNTNPLLYILFQAVNFYCFSAFLSIPPAQFKLVLDSIIWAFKHTMRTVADTGLQVPTEYYVKHTQLNSPYKWGIFLRNNFVRERINPLNG